MHLLSIDLETTGLDPLTDQILEIGIVAIDLEEPSPRKRYEFRRLIWHSAYQGQAYALAMNAEVLKEIHQASEKKDKVLISLEELTPAVSDWLKELPLYDSAWTFVPTGKNVGSFDLAFLRMVPYWTDRSVRGFKLSHRCLDPGPFYFRPDDLEMPSLENCLKRAGLENRRVTHRALDDAHTVLDVIEATTFRAIHLETGGLADVYPEMVTGPGGSKMRLYRKHGSLYVQEQGAFNSDFGYSG